MSNPWQPGGEQGPPQPDWERWEQEHSSLPPLPSVQRPAPVDVETARHLWWGVSLIGFVNLLFTLWTVFGDKATYADQLVADVKAQDATVELTGDSAQTYLTVALVIMAVIGAGFGVLFLFWVNRMRSGKLWSRLLLTVIGTVTIVLALPNLFALGGAGGAVALAMGALGILQGVLAAGAIFLMHRKESNEYFLASSRK